MWPMTPLFLPDSVKNVLPAVVTKTDFFMTAAAPNRIDDMTYGEFRLNVETLFCVRPCNHTALKGLGFF